jgi:Fur family iron response transcriptional regulator
MTDSRPYTYVLDRLKDTGLRPTRQRLALAKLLLEVGDRHVTAEQLHCEASDTGIKVSLATIYNTLHQFTKANLLREVVVESGRAYFDTNTNEHCHISAGRNLNRPCRRDYACKVENIIYLEINVLQYTLVPF